MTYKLLYNHAVAMTGGQSPPGRLTVADLTWWLTCEGVVRTVITTDDPARYKNATLEPSAQVRHRDDLAQVEAELAAIDGVTVIIHDDRCATEERRMRKRGLLPAATDRVWINERVCEGCGDCGEKSTCLSVMPVDTEFGRKTRIHQTSCNSDMSCLKGNCPSFLIVRPRSNGGGSERRSRPAWRGTRVPFTLPEPRSRPLSAHFVLRMPGVGGTGVVTVSQIIQMAALLDGKWASGLDQTGLAQKGGPVISDVRIADQPIQEAPRASSGTVDLLLGLDLLGAARTENLSVCAPDRTVAILNTGILPTASMVAGSASERVETARAIAAVDAVTYQPENVCLDALAISEVLFTDHMPANLILLGAAFQHGCLPLSGEAIRRAIELNATAVSENLAAFDWGRALIVDPDALRRGSSPATRRTRESSTRNDDPSTLDPRAATLVQKIGATGTLRDLLLVRVSDLIGYQSHAYAKAFALRIGEALERETAAIGQDRAGITEAYASGLHRLMAYKDEYEVARLHLDRVERARLRNEFGDRAEVQILLNPPLLRALGVHRKLRFGSWFVPALHVLAGARRLRGTPFDPFGRTDVRRTERALVDEYIALMEEALQKLNPGNASAVRSLAELAATVRGFETIKLRNVGRFRERSRHALDELSAGMSG